MDFESLVRERKSIRGYKPDPVPKEVIAEIIEIAKGAPSSMNTQPWFFNVITGEPLERIREGNTDRMLSGAKVNREIPMGHGYEGIYKQRQVEIAVQLFEAMGIAREDKEMRQDWVMRGFRQFDAPVSIVMSYEKVMEPATISHFDLTKGLGTVINGQGIMQSDVVREHANIPDDQVIMTCIAMGYPDYEFAANDVKSRRAPNKDITTFVGFD